MAAENFLQKPSVVVVYTGNGKGKTSASLGLLARALGNGWKVAFIQFIKYWEVGEHNFINQIQPLYKNQITFYKGGKGFYNLGEHSAKGVSMAEHKKFAQDTYSFALECSESGEYDLVICDEINNAAHDNLITTKQLEILLRNHHAKTSICVTGRNFPDKLLEFADIATNMTKLKHHFDDKYLANKGIDY